VHEILASVDPSAATWRWQELTIQMTDTAEGGNTAHEAIKKTMGPPCRRAWEVDIKAAEHVTRHATEREWHTEPSCALPEGEASLASRSCSRLLETPADSLPPSSSWCSSIFPPLSISPPYSLIFLEVPNRPVSSPRSVHSVPVSVSPTLYIGSACTAMQAFIVSAGHRD
jgi:hypothetical protein